MIIYEYKDEFNDEDDLYDIISLLLIGLGASMTLPSVISGYLGEILYDDDDDDDDDNNNNIDDDSWYDIW